MVRPPSKSRINKTIDTNLLESIKLVAAQEGKYLNQLLEEGIRHILATHQIKALVPAKPLVPRQERRAHLRSEVSWPVSMSTGSGSISGEIIDISKGGARIQCQELPKAEESLELKIEIPDHCLNILATVEKIRLNINDSDAALYSYDLAVRFSGVNVDQRRNLYNAIEHNVKRIGP